MQPRLLLAMSRFGNCSAIARINAHSITTHSFHLGMKLKEWYANTAVCYYFLLLVDNQEKHTYAAMYFVWRCSSTWGK
jgi:hypothetical protein